MCGLPVVASSCTCSRDVVCTAAVAASDSAAPVRVSRSAAAFRKPSLRPRLHSAAHCSVTAAKRAETVLSLLCKHWTHPGTSTGGPVGQENLNANGGEQGLGQSSNQQRNNIDTRARQEGLTLASSCFPGLVLDLVDPANGTHRQCVPQFESHTRQVVCIIRFKSWCVWWSSDAGVQAMVEAL